jgi:hypothetical protein
MTLKITIALAIVLAVFPANAYADDTEISLPQLISACGKNTMCSNQTTREGTLFILRYPQRTQNLLCQDNGTCVTILAKGQRIRIQDSLSQISAR